MSIKLITLDYSGYSVSNAYVYVGVLRVIIRDKGDSFHFDWGPFPLLKETILIHSCKGTMFPV